MLYIDRSLSNPELDLAFDQALLEACEANRAPEGYLRVWEPGSHFVVMGRTGRIEREVYIAACERLQIPVFRRLSGGGTVLLGPGCLNYTLILRHDRSPGLEDVQVTNQTIMSRIRSALAPLDSRTPEVRGCTDLTVDGLKFAGNAQARKRHAILFHGTILLEIDLKLMEEVLRHPPREPGYREGRGHSEFLTTLKTNPARIKEALKNEWAAGNKGHTPDIEEVRSVARNTFGRVGWSYARS